MPQEQLWGLYSHKSPEDGHLHPKAFMFASFSPAELNYDTHDKELLAIITAFEHWHIFIEGTKEEVTVFIDHKNPEYWKTVGLSIITMHASISPWHPTTS
jgi:hypothetical protein